MKAVGQGVLPLAPHPKRVDVPVELIHAKRTQGAAFSLACDASGLEDKEIHLALGIDAGTFSRMKAGKNTLSGDVLHNFCAVVGNTIYPQWLAYQIGCGLVVLKSEAELRAEAAERALMEERAKVRMLTDLLQGRS